MGFKVTDVVQSRVGLPFFCSQKLKTQLKLREVPRLELFQLKNGVDTRFCVQAMTISENTFFLKRWVQKVKAYFWYVRVGYDQDHKTAIFVKVNSLATRLLVTKQEINEVSKKGKINEFIAERKKHLAALRTNYDYVDSHFKEIAACGEFGLVSVVKQEGLKKACAKAMAIAAEWSDGFRQSGVVQDSKSKAAWSPADIKINDSHVPSPSPSQQSSLPPTTPLSSLPSSSKSKKVSERSDSQKINSKSTGTAPASIKDDDKSKYKPKETPKPGAQTFQFGDLLKDITIEEEGMKFNFRAIFAKNKLHLIRDHAELQHFGHFVHIFKVYNFAQKEFNILKTNAKIPTSNRKVEVALEAKILTEINPKGERRHVQPPPVATFKWGRRDQATLSQFFEGGDLFRFINQDTPPKWNEVRAVFDEILEALEEFAKLERHHGDLKPHNILMPKNRPLMFIDWEGSTKYSDTATPDTYTEGYRVMADHKYLKTEQITDNAIIGKIDVYAFGVILHELVATGAMPEFDKNNVLDKTAMENAGCPVSVMNFIERMLELDIKKRYTVKQALDNSKNLVWQSFKGDNVQKGSSASTATSSAASAGVSSAASSASSSFMSSKIGSHRSKK